MKKLLKFLKSPKSDYILFLIVLVLANLVSSRSFVRFDLTKEKSYSLSKASRQVVKTLENPLSVKVFFSDNLNAPYSSVSQYVKDILVEYKESANKNFSYEFLDMKKVENEKLARDYGLQKVQIQEIKNNEVGLKQVWMGLAITYADRIEIMDGLSDSEGIEYGITTTISRMVSTSSTLSGLKEKVHLKLYKTSKMRDFKIIGFDQTESEVRAAYESVNKKNMGKITFDVVEPSQDEIPELSEKYGIINFKWNGEKSGVEAGTGIFGLVLEYGDKFNVLPLQISRDLFGRNMVVGLDELEASISEGLQVLVSKNQSIGYIVGHGELDCNDEQNGSGRLSRIISDRYSFKEINLSEENIPSNLACVFIDGPKTQFSSEELYKIDQFLMKGGNLVVFTDSFEETGSAVQYGMFNLPTYSPVSTGIEDSLEKYGIKINKDIVYDEECFVNQNQLYGKLKYYFAPLLSKDRLNQKNPVSRNLGYVIFLQNSSINLEKVEADKNLKATVIAKTSPASWALTEKISLNPAFISVPAEKTGSKNIAVLVEGKFSSAFENAPSSDETAFGAKTHLSKSVQNGKILVVSSSKMSSSQVLDENGMQPGSLLMRNIFDYMNGEEDLCAMRTKGLSLNSLTVRSSLAAYIAKYFNEIGLTVLVVIAGLLMLVHIRAKKLMIREKYNPNDPRVEQ